MINPPTLLRDTAIASLLLAGLGTIWGREFAGTVAAGALGGLLGLGLLARAVAVLGQPAFVVRLLVQHVVAGGLVILLASKLPVVPVLIGYCAVLPALAFHAFAGLFVAQRPAEP